MTNEQKLREALEDALTWYAEQARLCRLIHSEGDAGRNALAADGGERARAALAASRAAPECHQPDLVTVDRVPECSGRIREITEADMANIVAHLSYECEPTGPLPSANSLMMEIVRLRNELAALDLTPAPEVEPVAWMYELATMRDAETGEYSGWGGVRVTQNKPCVSEGSIRDLTPLYAHPPTPTVQEAARVLMTAMERAQIDMTILKLFMNGQPVAALRAIGGDA